MTNLEMKTSLLTLPNNFLKLSKDLRNNVIIPSKTAMIERKDSQMPLSGIESEKKKNSLNFLERVLKLNSWKHSMTNWQKDAIFGIN